MLKLLIASLNKDKLSEIRELIAELDLDLFSLRDYPDLPATDEDQDTIRGNAMKKALEAAQRTGLLALADDTGLFIKALNDEPGVYAARFAGEHCSYKDNRDKALLLMQDTSERYAEFRTCCALAAPDGIVAITQGCLPGLISKEERGENGFGYDSIFEPDPGGRTYAEMTDTEKNSISHRALALRKMLPILQDIITLK